MPRTIASAVLMVIVCARVAGAQQTPPPPQPHDTEALAKQLSNPVSSLVSVPFQFNW